jgi:O-succinylbenzoate synthase
VGELLEKVESRRKPGYRRIKIKIKPGHDLELVAAIRAAIPTCR